MGKFGIVTLLEFDLDHPFKRFFEFEDQEKDFFEWKFEIFEI